MYKAAETARSAAVVRADRVLCKVNSFPSSEDVRLLATVKLNLEASGVTPFRM
jgi:hypothetical protein